MTENPAGQVTWSDLGFLSGRTLPEHSAAIKGKTSGQCSKKSAALRTKAPLFLDLRNGGQAAVSWETDTAWHGAYSTHSFGESPSVAAVSRLSQILEDTPHRKYYLSAKACAGMLRRAEKRGKELPPKLKWALVRQAMLETRKSQSA